MYFAIECKKDRGILADEVEVHLRGGDLILERANFSRTSKDFVIF